MKFENIIIEMIQHDVEEIATKEKELVGKGAFHNVYISKKNPNVVYKIGFDEDVNGWVDIFKGHPDLFPKVYKMGHINIKLKKSATTLSWRNGEFKPITYSPGDTVNVKYVELEKLDTFKAQNDWLKLDYAITDLTEEGWEFQDYVIHLILNYTKEGGDYDMIDAIDENIKVSHPEMVDVLNKFVTLIRKICEVKKRPDLHIDNFGYDKDGNLKCLDI